MFGSEKFKEMNRLKKENEKFKDMIESIMDNNNNMIRNQIQDAANDLVNAFVKSALTLSVKRDLNAHYEAFSRLVVEMAEDISHGILNGTKRCANDKDVVKQFRELTGVNDLFEELDAEERES